MFTIYTEYKHDSSDKNDKTPKMKYHFPGITMQQKEGEKSIRKFL